jgi:hypothetical protein
VPFQSRLPASICAAYLERTTHADTLKGRYKERADPAASGRLPQDANGSFEAAKHEAAEVERRAALEEIDRLQRVGLRLTPSRVHCRKAALESSLP